MPRWKLQFQPQSPRNLLTPRRCCEVVAVIRHGKRRSGVGQGFTQASTDLHRHHERIRLTMLEDGNIFAPRLNRKLKNFTAQLERTAA